MKKSINKKYAELLIKAENATKRNEAIFLIKKAKKACPFASICGGEATWIIYVGSHEEKKCIGVSAQQWSEDRLLVSKDITAKSVFEGIENKIKFYYWAQNDPNEVFETLKQGKEPIR